MPNNNPQGENQHTKRAGGDTQKQDGQQRGSSSRSGSEGSGKQSKSGSGSGKKQQR